MASRQQNNYNFYLLNHEDDRQVAATTLKILEQRGLRGFWTDRDGRPGELILSSHESALKCSTYVIVVVSNIAVTCGWWKFQTETSLMHRVGNPEQFETVIPMYLPDFDPANQPISMNIFNSCYYNADDKAQVWDRLYGSLRSH